MAVKPVKFISDILAKRRILKTDSDDNVLFSVSGSLSDGCVSSSLPITASSIWVEGDVEVLGTINAKRMHITEITNSVYYEDSLSASINALQDVSASNAVSGNILRWDGNLWVPDDSLSGIFSGSFSGSLYGTSSYADSSSYAITAAYALTTANAVLSINDLTDVSASTAIGGQYLKFDGTNWIPGEANGVGVSRQQYINLRFNTSGTFLSEVEEIELPPTFTVQSIKYFSFSLLTRQTSASNWQNDLASVEFKPSGSSVWAVISAPTLPYEYTFNVINDNPNDVEQAIIVGEYTDLFVSGNLVLSGSPMPALNITASNYNVNSVLQTINNKFTNLQLLSEQQTGSFDINGFANIQLNNFSFSDLDYVMVDVMVKVGSSTTWKNDLISVELSGNISTNKLHVLIDAPALTNTDYFRIFANKHTESL